ncbi:MAG: leucine-rich repeat protein [Oscillospiraceae bacterium]|jgi:hypothetical protein|nr:leucine-rich repeat protein [Oscillospiraceae bacterium]
MKKLLALVLSVVMFATLLPRVSFAAEEAEFLELGGITYFLHRDTAIPIDYSENITFYPNPGGKVLSTELSYDDEKLLGDKYSQENRYKVKAVAFADGMTTLPNSVCSTFTMLETVIIPASVKEIPENAFYSCQSLKEIVIPEGVTRIGGYAFAYCENLASITLPSTLIEVGNAAFSSTAITSLVIPEGVPRVASNTFQYMEKLESLTLPSTIQYIDNWSLPSNESFMELSISGNKRFIYEDACLYDSSMSTLLWVRPNTTGSLVIRDSVTEIRQDALYNTKIEELTLPRSLGVIPYTFYSMPNLRRVNINMTAPFTNQELREIQSLEWVEVTEDNQHVKSVDGIMYSKDGTQLMLFPPTRTGSFTIPESVEFISQNAFYFSKLDELTLDMYATEPNGSIFGYDSGIRKLNLGKNFNALNEIEDIYPSLRSIEEFSVDPENPYIKSKDGVLFSKDGKTLMTCPIKKTGTYTTPEGVEIIAKYAFSFSSLSELIISEGVSTINERAFTNAEVEKLSLPATAVVIGGDAFYGLEFLTDFVVSEKNPVARVENGFVIINGAAIDHFGEYGESLVFPKGITKVPNINYDYDKAESVTNVIIPEGVTEIEEYALQPFRRMERVSLPFSLKKIGDYAFSSCVSLTSVLLPPNLEYIGLGAFAGCERLGSIVIPDSVKWLSHDAFTRAGWGYAEGYGSDYSNRYTGFDLVGRNSEMLRWAAYMSNTDFIDKNDPTAKPQRITSLLPEGVTDIVVLQSANTDSGITLYSDSALTNKITTIPNGTPAYVLETSRDYHSRILVGGTEGWIGDYSTLPASAMTGDNIPVYATLMPRDAKPLDFYLYEHPITDAPATRFLFDDHKYMRVVENLGTWLKLETQDGAQGYMPVNQLYIYYAIINPSDDFDYYSYMTVINPNQRDRLNLREQPSRNSASLGKYLTGFLVKHVEDVGDGQWVRVITIDRQEGYMMREFLRSPAGYPSGLLGQYDGQE